MVKSMKGLSQSTRGMLGLLLAFCFSFSGCALQAVVENAPTLDKQGRVSLYLQPLPQEMHSLTFIIEKIAVVAKDGTKTSLATSPIAIKGREFVGVQKLLTAKILDPGNYQGILILLSEATMTGEKGEMNLRVADQPLLVSQEFSILPNKDFALFLTLFPENLITDKVRFSPVFSLGVPRRQTSNFTGFVSQAATHTVAVFNKRTMEVFRLLSPGTTPQGMALDDYNGRLYVALAGDDAVAVIDVDTLEIVGRIKLFFGDRPMELALTGNGDTLIAANHGSRTISIIETSSLYEKQRVQLNSEPTWMVTSKTGRQVYILQAMDNSVAIIDLKSGGFLTSLALDESPEQGALSRDGNHLIVIGKRSNDLLVIDLQQLKVVDKIFIGSGAVAMTVDSRNNLGYIGKHSGEIVIVDVAAQMFLDSFTVSGDAEYLALDSEESTLFILSADHKLIHKVNRVSKQRIGSMETAGGGHTLVIMGER